MADQFKLEVEVDPMAVLQETEQRLLQEIHNVSVLKAALNITQEKLREAQKQLEVAGNGQYYSGANPTG